MVREVMNRLALVIVLFVSGGALPAYSQQPPGELVAIDCRLGFPELLGFYSGRPDAVVTDDDEFRIIEFKDQKKTYHFTKENHYAHPTIVVRQISESDGKIGVKRTACAYGEREPFKKLMAEFKARDEEMGSQGKE